MVKTLLLLGLCFLLSSGESIAEPSVVYEGKLSAIDAQLSRAIHAGDVKAVDKSLRDGANPNARRDDYIRDEKLRSIPFLHDAVRCINLADRIRMDEDVCYAIAKTMLAHGADVGIKDMRDNTPLHIVASYSSARLAELLLEHGADLDEDAVYHATRNNNLAVLKVLHAHGAEVNISPAESGRYLTPLSIAVSYGLIEIVKFLLKHGASVNGLSTDCRTPLHVALSIPPYWRKWSQERTDILQLLLRYEPATNIEDSSGRTALERAQATREAKERRYAEAMDDAIKILTSHIQSTREGQSRVKCGS